MSWSYREKEILGDHTVEREWTFATERAFKSFVREHRLDPEICGNNPSLESFPKIPDPEGSPMDAGMSLKEEIDKLRATAGVPRPSPKPDLLEEIKREAKDRELKAFFLRKLEDFFRIRRAIEEKIGLDGWTLGPDFSEEEALIVLRPFGDSAKESTFAVVSVNGDDVVGKVVSKDNADKTPGWTQLVTLTFEECVNPEYVNEAKTDGGSKPLL